MHTWIALWLRYFIVQMYDIWYYDENIPLMHSLHAFTWVYMYIGGLK